MKLETKVARTDWEGGRPGMWHPPRQWRGEETVMETWRWFGLINSIQTETTGWREIYWRRYALSGLASHVCDIWSAEWWRFQILSAEITFLHLLPGCVSRLTTFLFKSGVLPRAAGERLGDTAAKYDEHRLLSAGSVLSWPRNYPGTLIQADISCREWILAICSIFSRESQEEEGVQRIYLHLKTKRSYSGTNDKWQGEN